MIHCSSCGRDSRTSDVCEWCRQALTAAPALAAAPTVLPGGTPQPTVAMTPPVPAPPQPTIGMAPYPGASFGVSPSAPTLPAMPQGGGQKRVALTGEVVEVAPPDPTRAMPGGLPAYGAPNPLPVAAYAPRTMSREDFVEGPSAGERWEKFLAMGLPLMLVSLALIHSVPAALLWVVLGALFLLALMMGATGAIPSYDEAFADCAVVLVVSFLLGPLLGLAVYLLVCLIKQECNGGLTAILTLTVVVNQLCGQVFRNSADTLALIALYGLFNLAGFLTICLAFAGWLMSSFFRPVGE